MNIAEVIAWKFNNQEGMRCKMVDGAMKIIKFPGGLPDLATQASWVNEYVQYLQEQARVEHIKKIANAHTDTTLVDFSTDINVLSVFERVLKHIQGSPFDTSDLPTSIVALQKAHTIMQMANDAIQAGTAPVDFEQQLVNL